MSKMMKKTISLVLSIMMIVTLFTVPSFADDSIVPPESFGETNGILGDNMGFLSPNTKMSDIIGYIFPEGSFTIENENFGSLYLTNISISEEADQGINMLFNADFLNSLPSNITADIEIQNKNGGDPLKISGTIPEIITGIKGYIGDEAAAFYENEIRNTISGNIETIKGLTLQDLKNYIDGKLAECEGKLQELQGQLGDLAVEKTKEKLKSIVSTGGQLVAVIQYAGGKIFGTESDAYAQLSNIMATVMEKLSNVFNKIDELSMDETADILNGAVGIAADCITKLKALSAAITIEGSGKTFGDMADEITTAIKGFISNADTIIINNIRNAYENLLTSIKDTITNLKGKMSSFTQADAKAALVNLYDMIKGKLADLKTLVGKLYDEDAKAVMMVLIDTVTDQISELKGKLDGNISNAKEALKNAVNTIQAYIAALSAASKNIVKENWQDFVKAVEKTIHVIYEKINGFKTHVEGETVQEPVVEPTCYWPGLYDAVTYCEECGEEIVRRTVVIPPLGHDYETKVIKKATMSAAGTSAQVCTRCGKQLKETTIDKIQSVALSKKTYVYNGNVKRPSVTVKDSAGKVIDSKYYTVIYSNRNSKNAGNYTVTVKFKDKYSGTKKLAYTITKAANPMTISKTTRTYKSKSLTTAKTFNIGVKNAQGTVTYTPDAKAKSVKIKVDAKGKVTIPKNCKAGTYKIKCAAKGNANYKGKQITVTIRVI